MCIKGIMKSQKKTNNYYSLRILFTVILILGFSAFVFGQTKASDKTSVAIVTNDVRKQIVRGILIRYFKPRNQKKTVYLAKEGLQQSWLPRIKGIDFQLLSPPAYEHKHHYVFTDIEKLVSGKYEISFAHGCMPGCGYMGDIWNFRILKQRVLLWKTNGSFVSSGVDYGSAYDLPLPQL